MARMPFSRTRAMPVGDMGVGVNGRRRHVASSSTCGGDGVFARVVCRQRGEYMARYCTIRFVGVQRERSRVKRAARLSGVHIAAGRLPACADASGLSPRLLHIIATTEVHARVAWRQ